MCGRPDHVDASTAPASHSARVSTPMMAPRSYTSDLLNDMPAERWEKPVVLLMTRNEAACVRNIMMPAAFLASVGLTYEP